MKKQVLFILFAAFTTTLLFSCRKEYTCTCKDDTTGEVTVYKLTTRNKTLAKKACDVFDITSNTCSL